jgi:hypothetical protein
MIVVKVLKNMWRGHKCSLSTLEIERTFHMQLTVQYYQLAESWLLPSEEACFKYMRTI